METTRRHYTAEQKVAILREHLLESKAVSDLCDQYQIHPSQLYAWQKQLFENGTVVFDQPSRSQSRSKDAARMQYLETKLKQKDEVLAELLQEHIALKKRLGVI